MKEITNYRETSENSSEGSVKENINKPKIFEKKSYINEK